MKIKRWAFVISLQFLFLILVNCASTYYSRGQKYLEQENYDQAIHELKLAIVEDYMNIDAVRDMGIALYHKGKLRLAERFLRLALMRHPDDPIIFYHLGLIAEEQGDIEKAIRQYRRYVDISPFNALRDEIEGRLMVLLRQQMTREIQSLLARETALDVRSIPDNSIAVLYFIDAINKNELGPLQKGLTEMLITDLSQVKSLTVIERARLQTLMDEMGLGMTGLIDEKTAPKVGALLGAAELIQGTMVDMGENTIRIDVGLLDVKRRNLRPADKVTGSLKQFYKIEKDLAFGIIQSLGIHLSNEERDAIEKIPTKNLMAFMAFCKALDAEDHGRWDQARDGFQTALKLDPNFNLARAGLSRANAFSHFSAGPPKLSFAELKKAKGGPGRGGKKGKVPTAGAKKKFANKVSSLTSRRLYQTATQVNPGFIPSIESRLPITEESTPTFGTSAPILVRVPLPVEE